MYCIKTGLIFQNKQEDEINKFKRTNSMNKLEIAIHIIDREKMENETKLPKKTREYLKYAIKKHIASEEVANINNQEWQEAKSICFPTHNIVCK